MPNLILLLKAFELLCKNGSLELGHPMIRTGERIAPQAAPVSAAKCFEQSLLLIVVEDGPGLLERLGAHGAAAEKRKLVRIVTGIGKPNVIIAGGVY